VGSFNDLAQTRVKKDKKQVACMSACDMQDRCEDLDVALMSFVK
jgi:hypothetical protein